jgi:hypothetical protein
MDEQRESLKKQVLLPHVPPRALQERSLLALSHEVQPGMVAR